MLSRTTLDEGEVSMVERNQIPMPATDWWSMRRTHLRDGRDLPAGWYSVTESSAGVTAGTAPGCECPWVWVSLGWQFYNTGTAFSPRHRIYANLVMNNEESSPLFLLSSPLLKTLHFYLQQYCVDSSQSISISFCKQFHSEFIFILSSWMLTSSPFCQHNVSYSSIRPLFIVENVSSIIFFG